MMVEPVHTVAFALVGLDAEPREHRWSVPAGSRDAALRVAWDMADAYANKRGLVVAWPISVDGVELDAECNWQAVRGE